MKFYSYGKNLDGAVQNLFYQDFHHHQQKVIIVGCATLQVEYILLPF
jgi:hypothetical protein